MFAADIFALASASVAVPICDDQISTGSCSTHPGCGKNCVKGRCAIDETVPSESIIIARELVVPWSSARMKRFSGMMLLAVPNDWQSRLYNNPRYRLLLDTTALRKVYEHHEHQSNS